MTQTTWLRLVENLDRIKDPERLGAWLATTARRECLRHIRLRGRELQVEDESVFEAPTDGVGWIARIIDRERSDALWRAFARPRGALPGSVAVTFGAGPSELRRDRSGPRHADRRDRTDAIQMS